MIRVYLDNIDIHKYIYICHHLNFNILLRVKGIGQIKSPLPLKREGGGGEGV